jgi:hypothetical protein
MPTVLYINGWRLFFYTNERTEPPHIHCAKANSDAKYWLDIAGFDILPAYEYNISPSDRKMIRKIIFTNVDYITGKWNEFHCDGNE